MDKICKEYISDAKKFFPVMGRKERDYLRKVSSDIEDFIEAENITSKSELVEKYHQPYEVANNYYATFFDTDLIIKRIKISKYIKIFISILIVLMILFASIFIMFWNENHNSMLREEMVDSKNALNNEQIDESISNRIQSDNFISDEEIIEDEIIEWKEKKWKKLFRHY